LDNPASLDAKANLAFQACLEPKVLMAILDSLVCAAHRVTLASRGKMASLDWMDFPEEKEHLEILAHQEMMGSLANAAKMAFRG